MNVISRKLVRDFYNAKPERKQHAAAFENWFKLCRKAAWKNTQQVKATFGQTDVAPGAAGKTATIFDVGGNKFRIVALIDYTRQTVIIRAVMTHKEYEKNQWKDLF